MKNTSLAKVIRLFPEPKTISRVFVKSPTGRTGTWLHADDLMRWIGDSEMPDDWKGPLLEGLQYLRDAKR